MVRLRPACSETTQNPEKFEVISVAVIYIDYKQAVHMYRLIYAFGVRKCYV